MRRSFHRTRLPCRREGPGEPSRSLEFRSASRASIALLCIARLHWSRRLDHECRDHRAGDITDLTPLTGLTRTTNATTLDTRQHHATLLRNYSPLLGEHNETLGHRYAGPLDATDATLWEHTQRERRYWRRDCDKPAGYSRRAGDTGRNILASDAAEGAQPNSRNLISDRLESRSAIRADSFVRAAPLILAARRLARLAVSVDATQRVTNAALIRGTLPTQLCTQQTQLEAEWFRDATGRTRSGSEVDADGARDLNNTSRGNRHICLRTCTQLTSSSASPVHLVFRRQVQLTVTKRRHRGSKSAVQRNLIDFLFTRSTARVGLPGASGQSVARAAAAKAALSATANSPIEISAL